MDPVPELLGASPGIVAVRDKVRRMLPRSADTRRFPPILIEGETGTGKGLLAREIHWASPRSHGPFVDVNCAAIPETLLEAELFGYERGAFTDARHSKPGLFQVAHGGTIFLDEIGLLPEALQTKLLKVIEERVVRRLGGTRAEPLDVWIVAATNEDLAAAIRARRFREDLYHRVAVVTLALPPLRERGEDIVLLAEHFLSRACADYAVSAKALDAGARAVLLAHPWPGNVRELSNLMERVVLLTDVPVVTADLLELAPLDPETPEVRTPAAQPPLEAAIRDVEREHLLRALRATNWNVSRAATRLGISRNTARYRIEKHGLSPGAPPGKPEKPSRERTTPRQPVPAVNSGAGTTVRWERRRVAFLRADVAIPAGVVVRSRVLEFLVDKVQTFGGRVEELGGAGIVAVFGLEPVEDAPRRAANTAIAIQKAVERAQAGGGGPPTSISLVLHVGEVTIGRLDGGTWIDQEARRQTWSLLEALAARIDPGTIAVSDSAAPQLARRFELVPLDRVSPSAYRLFGQERMGLAAAAGMSAFVGREEDLALLLHLFTTAERGQPQILGVTGEAGIGKSRLVFELRRRLADRPVTYLEGHCVSYGGTIPYLPLLAILRAACGIAEDDSSTAIADKVGRALADVGLEAGVVAPPLLRLLGLVPSAETAIPVSPDVIKTRTFEALGKLLVRRSQRAPTVVVVEDLHWVDKTSEEFLSTLLEPLAGVRMLFVATYRSGYQPPWLQKSYATQIALQPLGLEDGRRIVRAVLGPGDFPETAVELIVTKAEGNPFFQEELARAVRERGLAAALPIPDTIEDVLLARIDRLQPNDKRLLQSAAVIGKDVPLRLVQAIAGLDEPALFSGLARLQDAEFLHPKAVSREVQYVFRHTLTQEVAYQSLLGEQRRRLHEGVVEAIERLHPGLHPQLAAMLAHHAVRGEVWDKAVDYLRAAGAWAFAKGSVDETLAWYEEALAVAARLPCAPDNLRRAIDVRLDLHVPLIVLGQVSRLHSLHEESETLARRLDDQLRLGRVLYRIGQSAWMDGRYGDGLRSAEQARSIASMIDDSELRVLVTYVQAVTFHSRGEYRASVEQFARILDGPDSELAQRLLAVTVSPYVGGCAWMGHCLTMVGELDRALAYSDRAVKAADTADHPQAQVIASTLRAIPLVYRGDLSEAVALSQRAVDLCMSKNLVVWMPGAVSTFGWALAVSGGHEEGLPYLERGPMMLEGLGVKTHLARLYVWLAEGLLLAGRLDEAERAGARAIELGVALGERGHEAEGRHIMARVAAAKAPLDVEPTRAEFEQARALAGALGMRPLLARCDLDLGRLYRRAGDAEQAAAVLTTAAALLRELGLRRWLEEAEAALSTA